MVQKAQIIGDKKRFRKLTIFFAIVLVAAITLVSGIKVIGTGEVGVVTQFGKVTGRELDEGLSFILPWGLNSVSKYDIKVQKETVRSTAASKDLQDVSSQIVLNYTIDKGSVSKIHQTIGVAYVDKIVNPAINEVFKAASAKYTAAELITERNKVKNEAQTTLSDRLKPYGITIEELSITDFKFSDNFSRAIEEKQVAQQNAERAKFNLEAARTDAEAQRVQSETLSTNYLRKIAIDKWDGKLPSYVGGGANDIFSIPLR